MIGAVYAFASTVVLGGFRQIERRNTTLNVQRACDAIGAEAEALAVKLGDWASWDETYRYAGDHNTEFERANLTRKSLERLGLAAVLLVDQRGQLVFGASIGPSTTELAPAPASLVRMVSAHDPFFSH